MMAPNPQLQMNLPEDSSRSDRTSSAAYASQTSDSPIPWTEIFSRHESVLNTHLQMLDSVKSHVARDGEAFRAISSMVNKTIQAMNQFKVVRKHMMNKKILDNPNHSSSASAPNMSARPTSTVHSTNTETSSQRKRSRPQKEGDTSATSELNTHTDSSEEARASKRKRDTGTYSGVVGDQYNGSGSNGTEDISEEVQRRLRIKEERRRRKENAQPEKRKRESLISNESESPGASRPRKKRVRTGNELKRGGISSEMEPDTKNKRLKKTRA